jgi:hypothetical protein
MGGYTRLAKDSGKWLFETAVNLRTPGFEANDLAFNTRSDYIWMNTNLALSLNRPTKWYRNYFFVLGSQRQYNFDGDRNDTQFHAGAFGQLLNYWQLNFFAIRRTDTYDDGLLRGGPVVVRPGMVFFNANIGTDSRKRVSFSLNPNLTRGDRGNTSYNASVGVEVRAASNVQLSFFPSYSKNTGVMQYVTAIADPTNTGFYGSRYILSDLSQKTVGFDTRMNITFTPRLTFELYAQPFISSVHFTRFKQVAAPPHPDPAGVRSGRGNVVDHAGSELRSARELHHRSRRHRTCRGLHAEQPGLRHPARSVATPSCAGNTDPDRRSSWCGPGRVPATRRAWGISISPGISMHSSERSRTISFSSR